MKKTKIIKPKIIRRIIPLAKCHLCGSTKLRTLTMCDSCATKKLAHNKLCKERRREQFWGSIQE